MRVEETYVALLHVQKWRDGWSSTSSIVSFTSIVAQKALCALEGNSQAIGKLLRLGAIIACQKERVKRIDRFSKPIPKPVPSNGPIKQSSL